MVQMNIFFCWFMTLLKIIKTISFLSPYSFLFPLSSFVLQQGFSKGKKKAKHISAALLLYPTFVILFA